MFAGSLLLGINSCVVPEEQTTHVFVRKTTTVYSSTKHFGLKKRVVPFSEEVSCGIQQQEHLFLSLGAVSCVQMMLQRHRPLHCADHVNMLLLDTTGDTNMRGKCSKNTKMQLMFSLMAL